MRRQSLVISALAVLALVLTACTSGSETATSVPPPTTGPAVASPTRAAGAALTTPASGAAVVPPTATLGPRVKLKVSYPDGGGHSVVQYGFEKGIYSKYNLDVELAGLGGGSPAMAALIAG